MKKTKLFISCLALAGFMSSCVVSANYQTTGNPVGSKVGTVKANSFNSKQDVGVSDAAKKGGIKKIATVDVITKYRLFFTTTKTTVTGE